MNPGGRLEGAAGEPDGLALEYGVLGIEQLFRFHERHPGARRVPQLGETGLEPSSHSDAVEIAERDRVLCLHSLGGLGAVKILEPAVGSAMRVPW